MHKLHGHKENTAPVLLCDIIEHVQAAQTKRKHWSNTVGRVCCRHCLTMDLHDTIQNKYFTMTLTMISTMDPVATASSTAAST
jgi:hypothetical protein